MQIKQGLYQERVVKLIERLDDLLVRNTPRCVKPPIVPFLFLFCCCHVICLFFFPHQSCGLNSSTHQIQSRRKSSIRRQIIYVHCFGLQKCCNSKTANKTKTKTTTAIGTFGSRNNRIALVLTRSCCRVYACNTGNFLLFF